MTRLLEGFHTRLLVKKTDPTPLVTPPPELLCGFRTEHTKGAARLVALVFQLPVAPSAVALHVTGFADNEAALLKLLETLVQNFKGRSTWNE